MQDVHDVVETAAVWASARVLGFCFVLAGLAGLMAAFAKRLSLRDSLVAAGVSGVGGTVVGAICVSLWGADKWYLTCAVCGIAGWAGGNLILDRLTFVAWTIAKGKVAAIGEPPELKEAPRASIAPEPITPTVDPLADLDALPGHPLDAVRRRV